MTKLNKKLLILAIIIGILSVGVKVFSMDINNPPYSTDFIKTSSGEIIRCKILPIGSWNMDTTSGILVPHGLGAGYINIVSCTGYIRNDAGTQLYPINSWSRLDGVNAIGIGLEQITNSDIVLVRLGTDFDNVSFDDPLIDRGKLLIWYIS